jgi:hypothetical protein
MNEPRPQIDVSDAALNVAVRGDRVLILGPRGLDVSLTLSDARRSLQRLADAIAVAEGRSPVGPGV